MVLVTATLHLHRESSLRQFIHEWVSPCPKKALFIETGRGWPVGQWSNPCHERGSKAKQGKCS